MIGYTEGKGERKGTFGALQIVERIADKLVYRGKVGTGFDIKMMKHLVTMMERNKTLKSCPAEGKPVDPKITTWMEPELVIEVSYAQITTDKMFREPVFVRTRPDL